MTGPGENGVPGVQLLYVLRLYVSGMTPRSQTAVAQIRDVCEKHLSGRVDLQVVDIRQHPDEAVAQQIVAAPTLVKFAPPPLRRLVGNLTQRDRVLAGLGIETG